MPAVTDENPRADSGEPRQPRLSGSSLQGRGALRRIDDAVGGTAAARPRSLGFLEQLEPALQSLRDCHAIDLATGTTDDPVGELRDLRLVEATSLVRLHVFEGVREINRQGVSVVSHQQQRSAEALLLTSCRYDGLIKESGGLDDVFWLDLDVGDPCVHRSCSLGWVRRWACLLGRRSLHCVVHDADPLLRGGGRPAHAATAGRSTPITLSRRVSALKANSFTSELE